MEVYYFPHLGASVHAALFHDVKNAALLRARLISASTMTGDEGMKEREAVNFAFIDARLITSHTLLETAIHQALLMDAQGNLRTKYIHSEILWVLNPGNNISEAIRRFGIADTSTDVIVVRVSKEPASPDDIKASMKSVVQGNIVPFDQLPTDWAAIKKYYKLGSDASLAKLKSEDEQRRMIDRTVISIVAIKPVAS